MFKSNGGNGNISEVAGFPLFTFRDTYRNVTLTNESDHNMVVHRIEVINKTAVTPGARGLRPRRFDPSFEFDHARLPLTIMVVEKPRRLTPRPQHLHRVRGTSTTPSASPTSPTFWATSLPGTAWSAPTRSRSSPTPAASDRRRQRPRLEIVEINDGPTGPDFFRKVDANPDIPRPAACRRALTGGETADSGFTTDIEPP
jgi:hypothetical protein